MSSPMRPLIRHRVFWAGDGFVYRGLWIWVFKRNRRIVPLNNPRNWFGREEL